MRSLKLSRRAGVSSVEALSTTTTSRCTPCWANSDSRQRWMYAPLLKVTMHTPTDGSLMLSQRPARVGFHYTKGEIPVNKFLAGVVGHVGKRVFQNEGMLPFTLGNELVGTVRHEPATAKLRDQVAQLFEES